MNNHKITQFTALRGLAALWLVFFHYSWYTNIGAFVNLGLFTQFIKHGYLGVDLFYCLSGYILCFVYGETLHNLKTNAVSVYARYLRNRLARIYPVYLFTLLLVALLYVTHNITAFVLHFGSFSLKNFFLSLFLIQSWGINTDWTWNMPSWTVSIEWLLYLIFPILIKLFYRWKQCFLFIGIIAVFITLFLLIKTYPKILLYDAMKYGFLRAIPEFSLGIFFCLLQNKLNISKHVFADVAIIVLFISLYFSIQYLAFPTIWILILSAILFTLPYTNHFIANVLNSTPLQFFGKISYSLYLLQFTIQIISNNIFERKITYANNFIGILALLIEIGILCFLASIVYYCIEEPLRKRFKVPLVNCA
jgi:peptidoglycan/LPS O-acetylase OafA/YrhL